MKAMNKRQRSYLYLLLNVIVWGAALPIVKIGLDYTTPFRYLFYRFCIASICSLPILWHYLPTLHKYKKLIRQAIALELLGATIALSLLYFGLERTGAIQASLIVMTTPIFITLGGIYFLREREELAESIGLAIAFVGTCMLVLLPTAQRLNLEIWQPGNILLLAQNIATAVYFLLAKKIYKNKPKFLVTTISFYVGASTFGLLSFWEAGVSFPSFSALVTIDLSHTQVWMAALYMAIFGSIIGLTAYIKGQDGIEASEASLFGYLQPLIFIPFGIFLLHERISLFQTLALLVILSGILIAQWRKKK